MPIEIASRQARIAWDDPETHRRADEALEQQLSDALMRARRYIDIDAWCVGSGEEALDAADTVLIQAVELLKERLASPIGLETGELIEICRLAVELQGLHCEHQERKLGRRLRALSAIKNVLARPRADADVSRVLEHGTVEACRTCGFDRAMLFLVEGSKMSVKSTYFHGHDGWAAECHAVAEAHPVRLSSMLLETEMLRRRAAALMLDPMDDPRAFWPIVRKIETAGYVAVPIMPEGTVIATIHADTHFSGRRVDTIDRDVLAAFATGLGASIERQVLVERLLAQRDHVRTMLQETDAFISDFCTSEIRLTDSVRSAMRTAAPRPTPAMFELGAARSSRTEALLSRRELEVLRLMASGATNAVIADQLVLAEGTVKSHVKRILRKLHAANRAEAVSRFLRLEGSVQSVEDMIADSD